MNTDPPIFPSFLRPMRADETEQVDALLRGAFGGPKEAELVVKLRKSGVMAGEMVLPLGDGVIGYYALSKMVEPKGWLCLAPVAIAPEWQGKNHGKRMISQLVAWAESTKQPVVVLGQVAFYEAAGFSQAQASQLQSPYPVEHTMLAGHDGTPAAKLTYPKAFEGL